MTIATPYNSEFYSGQRSGSYKSAIAIVPLVNEIIAPRSVCDVGCGVGTWLRVWKNNGVDEICGLDGDYVDRSLLMIDESQFHCHDLRDKLPVTKNFDLALSLEVAEHLPQDRAESFVAELTAIAPVILFSAAIPNQGGTDHVNEQWQDYWAELFMKRGFKVHDVIRPAVWNNDHVERWYRQNMILYCREDKVANYPALSSAKTLPLSIVHPKQYAGRSEEYTVFETLVLLKGSLRRAAERRLQRLTGKYRPTNAKEVGF